MIRSTLQAPGLLRVHRWSRVLRTALLEVALWTSVASLAAAQGISSSPDATIQQQADSLEEIGVQVREYRRALEDVRAQLAGSRRELELLRQELNAVREQLNLPPAVPGQAWLPSAPQLSSGDRIDRLVEEQDLLRGKVEDQEQTKVESGSKYHVRLSGLVLLNVVSTRGSVDDLDLPEVAQPRVPGDSGGSLMASARQSRLGLDVFGPTLGGARTTGSLAFDFFGGFPATPDGVSAPLVRLRTATFSMDWPAASVVAGQDVPFFSPRSPTSLASTAYPSLSAAGNIWAWIPQVHVDHRLALSPESALVIQWGVLDPLTGELPAQEYDRVATAGERSRLPAQAIRAAWQRAPDARAAAIGAAAYHARQNWGFGRTVDAWAVTADWEVPIGPWFALSGELYNGQAIAGLGAGASDSVVVHGPASDPASVVQAVESAGGWSQLKFKPDSRLEFNAAFGEDNPFKTGLSRLSPIGSSERSTVSRNASGFVNAIYQARSNLLFSLEYRRLWTTNLDQVTHTADHLSFMTGVVF